MFHSPSFSLSLSLSLSVSLSLTSKDGRVTSVLGQHSRTLCGAVLRLRLCCPLLPTTRHDKHRPQGLDVDASSATGDKTLLVAWYPEETGLVKGPAIVSTDKEGNSDGGAGQARVGRVGLGTLPRGSPKLKQHPGGVWAFLSDPLPVPEAGAKRAEASCSAGFGFSPRRHEPPSTGGGCDPCRT